MCATYSARSASGNCYWGFSLTSTGSRTALWRTGAPLLVYGHRLKTKKKCRACFTTKLRAFICGVF